MATLLKNSTLAVTGAALLVAHLSTPAFLWRMTQSAALSRETVGPKAIAPGVRNDATRERLIKAFDKMPLRFEENREASPNDAKFVARVGGADFGIKPTEVVTRLQTEEQSLRTLQPAIASPARAEGRPEKDTQPYSSRPRRKSVLLRMQLVGANRRARVSGESQLATRTNYFIGNDPRLWRTHVPNYERVRVDQIYRGVDVVYYGSGQQLEYDLNVAPGADYRKIRLRFAGAQSIYVDGSELVVKTSSGEIRQHKPVAYQQAGKAKKGIAVRFRIVGRREITFRLGGYDRTQPVVIDPVLVYSTLIGGGNTESGASIAVDSEGNAYVTGKTDSIDLPTTPSAFQATYGGPHNIPNYGDAFVAKLNHTGTALIYSTYVGGSDDDSGAAIAVDLAGNAYVTGQTRSINFPTTPGSLQTRGVGSGGTSAFVVKLSANGSLMYSTYLGGSIDSAAGYTIGSGIAVDSLGNAYVAGYTGSTFFPTTQGAYQTTHGGGSFDAFVTKLNPAGTALVYSTFLGGNGFDYAYSIAVDSSGNAYVTGTTGYSYTTFPRTPGAFQIDFGSGANDAFVTKLNTTGSGLIYSTLLGGSGNEIGFGIAVDSTGNAHVVGNTESTDFPVSDGAFQTSYGGGRFGGDVFVTKLNSTGTGLIYSTYLGGSEKDIGFGISVDSAGNAHVIGTTSSSNFPTTAPLQRKNVSGPAFKSTDGGNTWSPINDGLSATRVAALAIDPLSSSVIYAGTTTGLFKSTNGGRNWSAANTGLAGQFGVSVLALAIDPQNPATLYASVPPGLFKSIDGGNTWRATPLMAFVNIVAVDPTLPTTLYAGAQGGVFKSTDGGDSWIRINSGLPMPGAPVDPPSDPPPPLIVMALVVDPATPSTLYLSTSQYGTYKSSNGGASWRSIRNGFQPIATTALLVDSRTSAVFAGGGGGVIRSTDGGATWTTLRGGLPGDAFLLAGDSNVPGKLYGSVQGYPTLGGFFKSFDGGKNWSPAGLSNMYIFALAIDSVAPSTLYAGTDSEMFRDDVFVTKLNAAGTALVYSTYLGGHSNDSGFGIAVDLAGNACATGASGSANFPTTSGSFQTSIRSGNCDAFVVKVSSPLAITGASIKGKKLFVTGDRFSSGAVIILNGEQQKTENDGASPTTLLIARRAGKQIPVGQAVTVQVRNPDGALSNEFIFTR